MSAAWVFCQTLRESIPFLLRFFKIREGDIKKNLKKKPMTDIDQQMVFDRLPLTAEQRKRLYDTITGAAARTETVPPVDSSASQDSPVQSDCTHDRPADSPGSQTH